MTSFIDVVFLFSLLLFVFSTFQYTISLYSTFDSVNVWLFYAGSIRSALVLRKCSDIRSSFLSESDPLPQL